ncbi:MAG: alpha/beta hydrolase fold domain-containing protein [Rhodoglobus sp.]
MTRTVVDGWPVFVLSPRDGAPRGDVIYLHGGCYTFEIDPVQWRFAAALAREARTRVTVPIFPLAPTGTASDIVPGVTDLVRDLVLSAGPDSVSIVGDSAGGGMALAVAQELRDLGVAALRATVLISPWLDISGTDPRLAEIAPRDPWLAVAGTHAAGALYRGNLPEDHPWVSPIHGDLAGVGPLTMFSGTRDILNADAVRLVAAAAAAGHPLDYHEGEGMIHVYPILPLPEGAAARAVIVRAVKIS